MTGTALTDPLTGHTGSVLTVATGQLDGRTFIVSGSDDRTVRVWDAATGAPIGHPFTGHTRAVRVVATVQVDGRTFIASACEDHDVRVWDATSGDPLTGYADWWNIPVATGQLDGRTFIVSSDSQRHSIWVRDAVTGDFLVDRLTGHTGVVHSAAVLHVDGRNIIVSASHDGTVRMWDVATGTPIGDPLTGHTGPVLSVTTGQLNRRTIIISGSDDNTIQIWDAATGKSFINLPLQQAGTARPPSSIDVAAPVFGLVFVAPSRLVAATELGVVSFRLPTLS